VLRRVSDPNIRLVYFAVFLLGTAYGISIAVTALHLDARGFTKSEIGQLAAFFASGIVVPWARCSGGSRPRPRCRRRS
jgi:hypothetical protein